MKNLSLFCIILFLVSCSKDLHYFTDFSYTRQFQNQNSEISDLVMRKTDDSLTFYFTNSNREFNKYRFWRDINFEKSQYVDSWEKL